MFRIWNCTLNCETFRGTRRECEEQLRWYKGIYSLKMEEVGTG